MNVLLIGGTGFIGTWLTKALCREHNISITDLKPFSQEQLVWLPGGGNWHVSGTDFPSVGVLENQDVIVPLTGLLGSVPSVEQPLESLRLGPEMNLHLLQTLAENQLKPLVIFPSSDLALQPRCLYSWHKVVVEGYLEVFNRVYDIPYISLRMATGYGPFQRRDSVINFYIRRALAGKTIPVYGKGDNRRAFIYIEDAARAFKEAIEGRFPRNRTYNLVGHNHTLTEVAGMVAEVVGGQVEHVPWPQKAKAVDVGHLPIGNDLAVWSWEPQVKLREGILKTKEWLNDGTS